MADLHSISVRYFAAAADASGCRSEVVAISSDSTLGDLVKVLVGRYGQDMERVLSVSAFLIGDELTAMSRGFPVAPSMFCLHLPAGSPGQVQPSLSLAVLRHLLRGVTVAQYVTYLWSASRSGRSGRAGYQRPVGFSGQ